MRSTCTVGRSTWPREVNILPSRIYNVTKQGQGSGNESSHWTGSLPGHGMMPGKVVGVGRAGLGLQAGHAGQAVQAGHVLQAGAGTIAGGRPRAAWRDVLCSQRPDRRLGQNRRLQVPLGDVLHGAKHSHSIQGDRWTAFWKGTPAVICHEQHRSSNMLPSCISDQGFLHVIAGSASTKLQPGSRCKKSRPFRDHTYAQLAACKVIQSLQEESRLTQCLAPQKGRYQAAITSIMTAPTVTQV